MDQGRDGQAVVKVAHEQPGDSDRDPDDDALQHEDSSGSETSISEPHDSTVVSERSEAVALDLIPQSDPEGETSRRLLRPAASDAPASLLEDETTEGQRNEPCESDIQESQEFPFLENSTIHDGTYTHGNYLMEHRGLLTAGVPLRTSFEDQGSDYTSSEASDPIPSLHSTVFNSDPYNIVEIQQLLLEQPQAPVTYPLSTSLSNSDIFSRLPEEILTTIANNLLILDVFSLRTASRSFWHIFHNQQFWKSRFAFLYAERSWVFEAPNQRCTWD